MTRPLRRFSLSLSLSLSLSSISSDFGRFCSRPEGDVTTYFCISTLKVALALFFFLKFALQNDLLKICYIFKKQVIPAEGQEKAVER